MSASMGDRPQDGQKDRPLALLDPAPRTTGEIFTSSMLARLQDHVRIVEPSGASGPSGADDFYAEHLPTASYVIGQPALSTEMLGAAPHLKAIFNVESNFLQNMDYEVCFAQGIHVLTVSPVFARPVAELALGMALSLMRNLHGAHHDFLNGCERYGLDGNHDSRLLHGSSVGFIGFGDLGRAILALLAPFRCNIRIHDPWLSPDMLARDGLNSASLDEVLSSSDLIFTVAAVTDTNNGMLGADEFARMQRGARFLLLSRADVVDFSALQNACKQGHIIAGTDVFPNEPVASDDPVRTTPGLMFSAHSAGALDSALKEIGERVVADIELMNRGLPPGNCKRAERELVGRMMSRPVEVS